MIVYNQEKTQELFNYDLTKGRLQYDNGVQIFIPYTEEELKKFRIMELKRKLYETDYLAIKFMENELSAEEYEPIKQKRRSYRAEINSLEEKLKNFA